MLRLTDHHVLSRATHTDPMSVANGGTDVSHIVLRQYYAHIGPLRQYLHAITDLEDLGFIDNEERLATFVSSITVASQDSWKTHTRHHAQPAETELSEVCSNSGASF